MRAQFLDRRQAELDRGEQLADLTAVEVDRRVVRALLGLVDQILELADLREARPVLRHELLLFLDELVDIVRGRGQRGPRRGGDQRRGVAPQLRDRESDRPELGFLLRELAAEVELRLELQGLKRRLVGRPLEILEAAAQDRVPGPVVDQLEQVRVGLLELQVLRLELPELAAQLVARLGDQRDDLVIAVLVPLLEKLLVGTDDLIDEPDRFVGRAGAS